MYPNISEKITAPSKRVRPGGARRACLAVCMSALAVIASHPSCYSADPFDRSAFSQIEFSAGCAQKQWTLAPDNSLELLVAPAPDQECQISLPFYFPLEIRTPSSVAFDARSTVRGPYLKVGVQEAGGGEPVFSRHAADDGL